MRKKLNELQAWELLAKVYKGKFHPYVTQNYICVNISNLEYKKRISFATASIMRKKIRAYKKRHKLERIFLEPPMGKAGALEIREQFCKNRAKQLRRYNAS
jgi:hypothetical protein